MDIVGESLDELLHENIPDTDSQSDDVFDLSEEDNDSFHDPVDRGDDE